VDDGITDLIQRQSGVVARRQVLRAGLAPHDIRRLLRRREWALVHPGVYVIHTGPLTWSQRAWAAVLFAWPAALCHDSAIRAGDAPGRRERDDGKPIHVDVDCDRSFVAPSGIRQHRLSDLGTKVRWNASPPSVRIEQAVLDVAAEARTDFRAIAILSEAVQGRRTTPARLREALDSRSRIARRKFLVGVLRDIADGTCSVLEHGYLTRVERPHGLPRAHRQGAAISHGPIYRDVEYERFGLVVELDGRLFHDGARARDHDLDRDLDAALERRDTVRIGWGQVFDRACLTALRVGRLLQQRGWLGHVRPCPSCPQDDGGSVSPGGSDPPPSD
jgi:hypothetical protein